MIYICIDHAIVYHHLTYSMNRKYEYATDKIYNHERSKDCIVINFRLLINQNTKK